MSVYRDAFVELSPAAELAAATAPGTDPLERLLRLGALEAALLDAACPAVDDLVPALDPLARLVEAAAAALAGGSGRPCPPLLPYPGSTRRTSAARAPGGTELSLVTPDPAWPARLAVKVPEGFAYYGLHPDGYVAAGRRLAALAGAEPCLVLGLRGIGTTLAACVLAGLRAAGGSGLRLTIRPRGHPFDRRPALAPALAARIAGFARVAVVDEGPGLSGSSLCGTASALPQPDARIVLVPAHDADPASLRSEAARDRWTRHPRIPGWADRRPAGRDLSGGLWRRFLGVDTPAHPPHERLKILGEDGVLRRFAGLGPYGRPFLERARALHDAGLGPRPHDLEDGFLGLAWLDGRPARDLRGHVPAIVRHLAFVARAFPTGRGADPDALAAMCREELGREPAHLPRGLLADAAEVAVDGRVRPHEWLLTPRGLVKADALDHHADHFATGCRDIAWDVAGLAVECGLDLAGPLAAELRDPALPRRLPWHVAAYAAFRAGYARLAGLPAERYARAAERALATIAATQPPRHPRVGRATAATETAVTHPTDADAHSREALFEMIGKIRTAMLTSWDGELMRARPMHAILDEESGEIRFFTTSAADRTQDAERFDQVCLSFADEQGKVWVSVSGKAVLDRDREAMRKHWNPFVAAWFPQGLDQPDLVLMRVVPEAAEYWDQEVGSMRYLFEVARANATGVPPRVGRNAEIELTDKPR